MVCDWLCGNAVFAVRDRGCHAKRRKMISLAAAAALELFAKGAALALTVYLAKNQHDQKK
ncbi:MAG: hypothetical protein MR473_00165 [Clostridiales bacterium]|nr:hypothetical protein [Clostridiales bacterium]